MPAFETEKVNEMGHDMKSGFAVALLTLLAGVGVAQAQQKIDETRSVNRRGREPRMVLVPRVEGSPLPDCGIRTGGFQNPGLD